MKRGNKINLKLFMILFIAGIIVSIAVLPYAMDLVSNTLKDSSIPVSQVVIVSIVQSVIMFAVAVFIGIKLYKKVNFSLPILEGIIEKKSVNISWKKFLTTSVGSGLLVAIIILILEYFFVMMGSSISLYKSSVPVWWKGLLGAIYGGIGEELLLRFCLMTAFVWVVSKFQKKENPTSKVVWVGIVIIAVIFGLLHLPVTAAMTTITPLIIARAILLNGIGGIVFGYLYWKKGLESAIIAHFSADIVLHVLLQLIL